MASTKILLFSFCCLMANCLFAQQPPAADDPYELNYQKRIKKQRLNGVYIPKDLYDAFSQLDRLMDLKTRAEFQLLPEARAGRKFYLIMWIVNNWGFYEGSRLSHYIRQLGITHPEHMAHFLVITYHRKLNKKELDLKERVEFYKEKEEKLKEKNRTILFEEKRKREQPQEKQENK